LPDKNPTPTQTGNTGGTIGTNIPAGQGGHILINPNADGTCPTGSHKFGAVCDKDIVPSTSGGPDPIVAVLQDGSCPSGYSKFGLETCKDNNQQASTIKYSIVSFHLPDGSCPSGYHNAGKNQCFEITCKNFNEQSQLCKDYFSPPTSASKPTSILASTQTGSRASTPECAPGFHWDNTQQKCVSG
jgi:hypothetical protein